MSQKNCHGIAICIYVPQKSVSDRNHIQIDYSRSVKHAFNLSRRQDERNKIIIIEPSRNFDAEQKSR